MTLQWRSVRTRGAVFVSFWSENWICICSVDACLCVNVVNVCKYRLPYIHSKKCFWKEECQNLLPTYISTFNILEISQLQTMTVLNQALYELLEHEFIFTAKITERESYGWFSLLLWSPVALFSMTHHCYDRLQWYFCFYGIQLYSAHNFGFRHRL